MLCCCVIAVETDILSLKSQCFFHLFSGIIYQTGVTVHPHRCLSRGYNVPSGHISVRFEFQKYVPQHPPTLDTGCQPLDIADDTNASV